MNYAKQQRKSGTTPSRFWTPTRIGLIGGGIILIAVIASTFFRSSKTPHAETAPANIPNIAARRAPARSAGLTELPSEMIQADIEMLTGKLVRLTDYNGKVVVIDLWATWCGPCRVEIPHLISLRNEFKDRGLEVIGLTTEDKATSSEAVRDFVKEFKINYPVGWANREVAATLLSRSGTIPQTLVIGRNGKVHKHLVGFHPRLSPPQLRAAIEEAIAE